jgi:hypothetical protein
MVVRETCPAWGADRYKKHGHTRHGKQHHQGTGFGRQFTADAIDRRIASAQRQQITQLVCEPLSLRGSCRAIGVSLTWLLHFMVECYAADRGPSHIFAGQEPNFSPTVRAGKKTLLGAVDVARSRSTTYEKHAQASASYKPTTM